MANKKFSEFELKTTTSNVSHVVGYDGTENVRITPANFLDTTGGPYLPLAGGTMTGALVVDAQGTFNDILTAGLGLSITGGAVGSSKLVLASNNYVYLRGGSEGLILSNSSGAENFRLGNTFQLWETSSIERMRLDASGNLGVGTSSPDAKLEVDVLSGDGILIKSSDIATLKFKGAGTLNWGFATTNLAAGDFGIYQSNLGGGDPITAGVPRMYFNSSGDVGVGTSTPGAKIQISGTNANNKIVSYFDGNFISGFKFSDLNGGIWYDAGSDDLHLNAAQVNSQMLFEVAGSEKMRLDSSGNLGLGTSSPSTSLDIFSNSSTPIKITRNADNSNVAINYTDNAGTNWYAGKSSLNHFSIGINANLLTALFNFTSSGNLLVGTTTTTYDSAKIGTGHRFLNVQAPLNQYAVGTLAGNSATNGNRLGYLTFVNENNSASYKYSAWMGSEVEGTTANQQGGRLVFATADDGSTGGPAERMRLNNLGLQLTTGASNKGILQLSNDASYQVKGGANYGYLSLVAPILRFDTNGSERMRLDSSGNLGLGQTTMLNTATGRAALTVGGSVSGILSFGNAGTQWGGFYGSVDEISLFGNNYVKFSSGASNTERMRITSAGNILVAKTVEGQVTTKGVELRNEGGVFACTDVANNSSYFANNSTSGTRQLIRFYAGTSQVGSISSDGSTTAYTTTSDYRLKEDLQDFKGLDLVSKIPVYDYKWKADESRSYGVMAHELQEVLPQAVSGDKDAEEMQSVDYSKIVPLLVKSIQELSAKLESLECQCKKK